MKLRTSRDLIRKGVGAMPCSSLSLVKKGQVVVVNSLKAGGDLQVLLDEGPERVWEEVGGRCKGKVLTCPFPLVWIPGQGTSLIWGSGWYREIKTVRQNFN